MRPKIRFYGLLLALLLGATAARAQTAPAPAPRLAPTDSGAVLLFNGWYLPRYQPRGTEADSTGALLSLFRKRRQAGWLFTLPFMAGMCLALPISSTDRYGQTTVADKAISPPLGIAVLGGTVAGFILHANKFNKAHLRTVAQAYGAGQPIPRKYRSQLNPTHFAEAAYLREALRQQQLRESMQRGASAR